MAGKQNRSRFILQVEIFSTISALSSRYSLNLFFESLNRVVTLGTILLFINLYFLIFSKYSNPFILTLSLLLNRGISLRRVNLPSITIDTKALSFFFGEFYVYNSASSPASYLGYFIRIISSIVARLLYKFSV